MTFRVEIFVGTFAETHPLVKMFLSVRKELAERLKTKRDTAMRVLIVDDHPVICEGLQVLLESYPDIDVVGTAGSSLEGLSLLHQLKPDCVILDQALPGMSGVEAIRLYLSEKPDLGIVFFTGRVDDELVHQVLQAGARAFVLKGTPVSALVSAIREVYQGGCWLSTEISPAVIRRSLARPDQEDDATARYRTLSEREKQVFMLLAKGKSPKEISEALFISIKTVSKHQMAIKEKLKLKNTAEMAIYAMRL